MKQKLHLTYGYHLKYIDMRNTISIKRRTHRSWMIMVYMNEYIDDIDISENKSKSNSV